ncbi:protein involved in gliding motility GldI [Flavobacterium succinicans]|jgi:gliding motility-associated peptidyl-prolyl isomerase|uniref:Peptidyl-prolyl cis-trans isomerase n=1 Tax=Flavobacterium succinicans TaxID=29536 RepID=A0A1I4U7C4_9FLAO|nr:gliding motility-associated peptidyl-prolyl isomerase GldI [Flavobacterium succinicans]SFM84795.1 protein involved in gliding motility GldI [Flavobacterium succinicans]
MNRTKNNIIVVLLALSIYSCQQQQQEARRPISQASGSFMKKSIDRNKKLVASEEDQIQAVIKKNAAIEFLASKKGYWYHVSNKNITDTLTPKKGDIAFFDYEVKDLKGNIIYTKEETQPQTYYVDKQNIMMGLRDGIKLMHKKETFVFMFPSHMSYGYHGDNKKIGTNVPLLCTVTLNNFMSELEFKKQEAQKTKALLPQKTIVKDTLQQ